MAHPKWALKHKTKGTELRVVGERYYLYKATSKWDKAKKRSVKKSLGYLGVVDKKRGLIPKGQRIKKAKPMPLPSKAREYGAGS